MSITQEHATLSDKPDTAKPDAADIVIPLHKEEVTVARRTITGDVVTIGTETVEREQVIDEPVTIERVEIEHVAINREIEAAPGIRQDGEITIIPVVEEIVVVQRRLMLKEELHVRRVRETATHHEAVRLREQHAVVTRSPSRDAASAASVTLNSDEQGDLP